MVYPNALFFKDSEKFYDTDKFQSTYLVNENHTAIVYKIKADEQEKIVKPFIQGKYSQIDRGYVEKHFTPKGIKTNSVNYQILTKSPALKKYWENLLEVTLDDDVEVWFKPEYEDEVLNAPKDEDFQAVLAKADEMARTESYGAAQTQGL